MRGLIIAGRMALDGGDSEGAVRAFERVVDQDVEFVPEILGPILSCYEKLGQAARARDFLR